MEGSKAKGICGDRWDWRGERLGCGGLWSSSFSLPCPHFPLQADQLVSGSVPVKVKLVSFNRGVHALKHRSAPSNAKASSELLVAQHQHETNHESQAHFT